MKFIPSQCKQCPFRPTSLRGWLGAYSIADVFRSIWHGEPFFCHPTIDYEDPNWLNKAMASGKLCVGGLVAANNMPAPASKFPQIVSARSLVRKLDNVVCMTWQEFRIYHDVENVVKDIKAARKVKK